MSLKINVNASKCNYPEGSCKYDEKLQYKALLKVYKNKFKFTIIIYEYIQPY